MKLLSQDEVKRKLKELDVNWTVAGENTLTRVFNFDDFRSALDFVNQVGEQAEEANHHPEIELSYGKVVVSLSTHSEGGLTDKDFELAAQIN